MQTETQRMTENRWRERDKVTLTAGEGVKEGGREGGMEGGELVLREETHPPRRGGSSVCSRYAVRRAQQHTAFPFSFHKLFAAMWIYGLFLGLFVISCSGKFGAKETRRAARVAPCHPQVGWSWC